MPNPRGRLGPPLGFLALSPRSHGTTQYLRITLRFDCNTVGIDHGAADEGLFDFLFDLSRCGFGWLERDRVGDALDASHTSCGGFRSIPLVVPLYLTLQRDQAVLDNCLYFLNCGGQ